MTLTDGSSTWWRDIPDAVLQQDQQQQVAKQWGDQARAEMAQQWRDSVQTHLPYPSDSLTNPLGTGNTGQPANGWDADIPIHRGALSDMANAQRSQIGNTWPYDLVYRPQEDTGWQLSPVSDQTTAPYPSDSLTNPLGTGNAAPPDAGAPPSSAPAASPEPMPEQSPSPSPAASASALPAPLAPVTASLSISGGTNSTSTTDFSQAEQDARNAANGITTSSPVTAPVTAPLQPPTRSTSGYVFPVSGFQGQVQDHWGEVKGGSDLFAPRGTPVVAMRGGKVIESGWNDVGGNSVLIQGDDGNQYYYAHFDKAPSVKVGDTVSAGTFLGPVGNTGDAQHTGTHLHIGIGPSILLGADKFGGTGGNFDAVGLLKAAQSGTPPTERVNPAPSGNPLVAKATDAANRFGIPTSIFQNLVGAESSWNPTAVSSAGAQGLTQLEPDTAKSLGVKDVFDPQQNLDGGARYLRQLYEQFGNWRDALIAYNEGPGRRSSGVILPKSAAYADKILGSSPVAPSVGGPDLGTQSTVLPTQQAGTQTGFDFGKAVQDARDAVGQVAGGVVQAAGQGFDQAVQGAKDALGAVTGAVASTPASPFLQPGRENVGPTLGDVGGAVGNFLTEPQPWMQNAFAGASKATGMPIPAGTTKSGQQVFAENTGAPLTPQEQTVLGRSLATGLAQTVVPEDLAARATTTGAGSLAKSAGVAEDLAKSRDMGGGYPFGAPGAAASSAYDSALNVPANRATATMLDAKPPVADEGTLLNRFVRAWTNSNEAVDRFQEDALKGSGIDVANPPENLDLAARVRQFATDGSVVVARDSVIKPAVQSLGGDEAAQKVLSSVLVHQNNVDVASALGAPYRTFPGGGSLIQSQTALSQMKAQLGPAEWSKVQGAADQVYGLVDQLRQRMLQSGLIDQHTYNMWKGQLPHWVPTRILDYLDEAGGPKVGSKITLSDNGVRHYTMEGTDKFREDPLASVLGLVSQVERNARKNDAVGALLNLDKLGGKPQLVATTDPVKAGESIVQYVNNGTVERYIAPPQLAAVINGPEISQAPGWVRAWTNFQRAVTTVLSPAFALVRNPSLDVPEYFLRQYSRAGANPVTLPHLASELAKGYADAFQGLLQGEIRGAGAQRYLGGGGSGSTLVGTFEGRQALTQGLGRTNPLEIKSVGDVQRIVKDLLTLKPVAQIAERTELGPRIAAMRLGEQQGMTPLRATLQGRTVTMDFNEGGTLAKSINQFIPFFNAGIQGTVIPARMFRDNPGAAISAMMQMVALPSVAAEAWNNMDPQRAQDYADVPQYLKQGGVVFMLPGDAATDAQGNRRPNFLWVNMRGLAPLSSIAREAAARTLQVAGNGNVQPENWGQLLADIGVGSFPIRANSIGDIGGAVAGPGLLPASGTVLQLQQNRDFFRNRDIATQRNDAAAGRVATAIANNLTAVAQAINPRSEVRPSQVDFAVRDLLGGVGSTLLSAGDIGASKDAGVAAIPVVGGAARAAGVRNDIGETFRGARAPEELLPDAVVRTIQAGGVRYQPQPVPDNIKGVQLTQAEQTRLQQITNKAIADILDGLDSYAPWKNGTPESRQVLLERLTTRARDNARRQFLNSVPDAEWNARKAASVP